MLPIGTERLYSYENIKPPLVPSQQMNTCYKIKLCVSASLLISSICATCIGIPALIKNITAATITVNGTVDVQNLTFSENIKITMDESDALKNLSISVAGIFLGILGAGMLLGMAGQNPR